MCGIIKPTKPTFPTKATAVPVKKITDKIAIALTSFVRCPRLIETSSPKERIVIDFDINSAKTIPIIPNGIVILMILGSTWSNFALNQN